VSRKVKTLLVPSEFIYRAFLGTTERWDYVIRREIEGIPTDAKVVNVWHCDERNAFQVAIEHPTFEEVEAGLCAPEIIVKHISEVSAGKEIARIKNATARIIDGLTAYLSQDQIDEFERVFASELKEAQP